MKRLFAMFMALALTALVPLSAQASGGHDLNGAELSILWVVPFVCMLLSIAIGPPCRAVHFWHHHFGKVALFWASPSSCPAPWSSDSNWLSISSSMSSSWNTSRFIILLFALFTIAGGVRLKGQLVGTSCGERRAARSRDHPRQLDGNHRRGLLLIRPAPGQ